MPEKSVVKLSVTPSTKYSCSGSPPMLTATRRVRRCAGHRPARPCVGLGPWRSPLTELRCRIRCEKASAASRATLAPDTNGVTWRCGGRLAGPTQRCRKIPTFPVTSGCSVSRNMFLPSPRCDDSLPMMQ
jgi:hypothetical protein